MLGETGASSASSAYGVDVRAYAVRFGEKLLPIITNITDFFLNKMGPAIGQIAEFFKPVVTGVEAFFAALSEGDVTSDGFVGFMETIGDFLHRNLPPAIDAAKAAFGLIVDFIKREVVPRFLGIVDTMRGFVEVALPIIQGFVKGLMDRITPLMPQVKVVFTTMRQHHHGRARPDQGRHRARHQGDPVHLAAVGSVDPRLHRPDLGQDPQRHPARTAGDPGAHHLLKIFKGDWSGAWEAIKATLSRAWEAIGGIVDLGLTLMKKALSLGWGVIKSVAGAAWDGVVAAIGAAWNKVTGVIAGPVDRAMQFIQENLIDKINGLFSLLGVEFRIKAIWVPGVSNLAYQGSRNKNKYAAADGGVLPGWSPGRDIHEFYSPPGGTSRSRAARRSCTEFTRAVGGPAGVAHINSLVRKGQAFADGGVFGNIAGAIGSAFSGLKDMVTDPMGSIRNLIGSVLGAVGSNPMARLTAGAVSKAMGFVVKAKTLISGMFGMGGIEAGQASLNGRRLDSDTARRIVAAARASGVGMNVIQGSWSHNPLSMGTHAGARQTCTPRTGVPQWPPCALRACWRCSATGPETSTSTHSTRTSTACHRRRWRRCGGRRPTAGSSRTAE